MRAARLPAARLLVPVAAVALLAGCTGDPAPTPTADRVEAEDHRVKRAGDVEAEPADAGTDGTAGADGGAADLATCIVGEWMADPADLVATSDAMMAAMGITATTVVTGEAYTTIDATTLTTTYVDQVTEMTADVEGQTMVSTTRMNGTLSQPYTLDGDILTSVVGDMSGVQAESTVTFDGVELPGYSEGFESGFSSGATAGQSTRQRISACSGDRLEMTTLDMAAMGSVDMTVVLTRR